MNPIKRLFKKNSHNLLFKQLAGFGRSLNRLYENRNHDIHSNGELTVIQKISQLQPKVMIDGGANIGGYSHQLHKHAPEDCQIYAFEPVSDTYDKLVGAVGSMKNVHPIKKGLFSESLDKEIKIYKSHTHSSIYDIQGVNYQPIDTKIISLISGDEFAQKNNIDFIDFLKLDLEGAEYDAILGFEELLKSKKIRLIQYEYGYINITSKKLLLDFYQLMNKYGYITGKVFPKSVEFRKYEFKHEDFIGPNFVAVRKDDKELIDLLK